MGVVQKAQTSYLYRSSRLVLHIIIFRFFSFDICSLFEPDCWPCAHRTIRGASKLQRRKKVTMVMTRNMRVKSEIHNKHIRGKVPKSVDKTEEEASPVGPYMIALFVFVVCGSAIFEVISAVARGQS